MSKETPAGALKLPAYAHINCGVKFYREDQMREYAQAALAAKDAAAHNAYDMYLRLCDAAGYDSGKDGMEFSPEEFMAAQQDRIASLTAERDALERIKAVGSKLSNCAFNLSQRIGDTMTRDIATTLGQLQRDWDAASISLRQAMAAQPTERKPLTFREIASATSKQAHIRSDYVIGIARAIEAEHGIT